MRADKPAAFLLLAVSIVLWPVLHLMSQATVDGSTKSAASMVSIKGRQDYVGDARCVSCHQVKSLSYLHTAHHLTSQLPDQHSILGSFVDGSNVLKISDPAPVIGDPGVSYKMEKRADGFYVTAITGFTGQLQTRSERIDIVIGAGVRGQSYLYWHGDALYELPVSYWTDGQQWINSPGYRNGPPVFDRPASPRCLECHVAYAQQLSPGPEVNRFNKATLVPGVGCETCHGPGARHVALHESHSKAATDEAILNPAHFSRDRQVDLCALCHNGVGQAAVGEAFSYRPGEPLDHYLQMELGDSDLHPDVHANQVGLLKRSRCYQSSVNMSCSTCHDVHASERAPAFYAARCLTCHRIQSCGMEKKLGMKIADKCIDCHMPVEQTNAIVSETADRVIRTKMRTHWIKVYPSDSGNDHGPNAAGSNVLRR
jgi:hypothetical protein